MDEISYRIQRTFRWMQGKTLQLSVRTAMGGGAAVVASKLAPTTASSALSAGEVLMSSVGGLATMGIGVGVNAYINHMEFRHNRQKLCDLYRPQIASVLGKEPGMVTVRDLEEVAGHNPSLQDELERGHKERSVKNIGAIVGTVAAFGAVFGLVALAGPLGIAGLAGAFAATGITTGSGLLFAGIAGAVGYATLQGVRKIAGSIGRKLTGLDKPSLEDKLTEISKHHRKERMIAPEQVLDVFLTARPELAEAVEVEYGIPFGKMRMAERSVVLQRYDEALGISEVTSALNNGQMNVRELTFRTHGQFSGVYPEAPWQDKLKEKAQETLDPIQDKLGNMRDGAVDKFQQWRVNREQSKLQDSVAKAIEEGRPLPEKAQEIGNEHYWRNVVGTAAERRAAAKAADGPARA